MSLDSKIVEMLEPAVEIFQKQGYRPINSTFLLHAFTCSVVACTGDAVSGGSFEFAKLTDEKEGKLHLIGLVHNKTMAVMDNWHVVAAHTTIKEFKEDTAALFPAAMKLQEFLDKSGDQNVMECFDAMPRTNKDFYAKLTGSPAPA